MDDLEKVFKLLVDENINLHYVIHVYLGLIRSSLEEKRYQQVIDYLQEAKRVGDIVCGELERAHIRLECAIADYKMKMISQAIFEIKEAVSILEQVKYSSAIHEHYYSVSLWMLGCLLFQSSNAQQPIVRIEAITAWQKSLNFFELRSIDPHYIKSDPNWYLTRFQTMRQEFKKAVTGRKYDHGETERPRSSARRPGFPPLDKPTRGERAKIIPGDIKYLRVIGEIPAGAFKSSEFNPDILEKIPLDFSMEEFTINGQLHELFNLRNTGRIIKLLPGEKYYVLKIDGDSMNKANIQSGDYVLLHYKEGADNGDIVAAEIIEIDFQVNLKKFLCHDDTVELIPMSSNLEYEPFEFTDNFPVKVRIRGVAIGVFKLARIPREV